jgi:hypothetical protein
MFGEKQIVGWSVWRSFGKKLKIKMQQLFDLLLWLYAHMPCIQ